MACKVITKDGKLSFLVDPTKVIGQGNEGIVYQVGKDLVAKIAKAKNSIDEEKLSAIDALSRKLFGIVWPFKLIYDEADSSCIGYLMPFIHGRTLEDILDAGETSSIPILRKIKLARLIANTVQKVHDQKPTKVVLGDLIKAANLIINGEKATFVDAYAVTIYRYRTKAGTVADSVCTFRTPGYTPPEVLDNPEAKPDHAADKFALAVLLFQLFFGQLPTEPKPSPASVALLPDDAVRKGLYLRYVKSDDFEAPTYDPIEVPPQIDDFFRAAFLSVSNRPTPKEWGRALTKWQREIDVVARARLRITARYLKLAAFSLLILVKIVAIGILAITFSQSDKIDPPTPTIPFTPLSSPLKDRIGSPLFQELFR